MMWLITIPAIAIPKVAVMWQSEPLICALVEHHSCSTSCWSPGASYTAVSVPLSPLMSLAFGHRHPPVPQALFTPWFCIGFSSLYTVSAVPILPYMMLRATSGATIAVIFGIYERLIADLADIREKLLHDLRFVIPLGIGIVLGLFVCAFGLNALMTEWEVPMMFFFAALIAAQVPDVKALGEDGKPMTVYNWIALAVGFVVMLFFLGISLGGDGSDRTVDSFLVWLVVAPTSSFVRASTVTVTIEPIVRPRMTM